LLVSLGLFNSGLMNDAVYKFKRFEDASLVYTVINRHQGEDIGLNDTVISSVDYKSTFVNKDSKSKSSGQFYESKRSQLPSIFA
jgi:hypothetical protein